MTENEAIKCLEKQIEIQPCMNVISAFEIAIQALEEIQQYRAIGLTPELIEAMQGHNVALINDLGEYQAIGTVEDIQEVMALCKSLQETVCRYMNIGTIDEFKALKEKNEPKKVADGLSFFKCPSCGSWEIEEFYETGGSSKHKYCPDCGQALDWE